MMVDLNKVLWLVVSVVVLILNVAGAAPHVPCFFIFGDSSSATANYLHHQNDFPSEWTDMLSDEIIAELLRFEDYIPPYATARGEEILRGVNYSSPAARTRYGSERHLGGRICLKEQVKNYQTTVSQIVIILGDEDTAANHLKECVYLVGIGSNGYINNYIMPDGRQFAPEKQADALIRQYSEQLRILYKYGARKVGLIGEGQNPDQHEPELKSACHIFKDNLKSLVNEFNKNLPDASFSFLDFSLNHHAPYVSVLQNHADEEPQVPCFFIFGDSLADNGNNNLLVTSAKANYPPYGIDFPYGSTGRFCNGRTMVDLLAELLGFTNYMPPFAFARDEDLLRGVNYASASAGIRDESGGLPGTHISLNQQLQNHQTIVSRISKLLESNDTAQEYLNTCFYTVGMGSNDYINNYFLPEDYNTSSLYSPEEYAQVLAQQYSQQLMTLYNLGARKFAVIGVGEIGCMPAALSSHGGNDSSCVTYMNDAAELFNIRVVSVIEEFNTNLTDAQFIYVNTTGMVSGDLSPLGITVSDVGCCSVGDSGLCITSEIPCQNRSEYAFWDAFHPTESMNLIMAIKSYNSSGVSDTYPMDIHTLANL